MSLRDSRNGGKSSHNNAYESSSTTFLKRLQQNLEDLTEQLQLANAKNIELAKLVEIVTEQRNYYCQELKKSEALRSAMEDQLRKEKAEAESRTLLVNELKKANRQLGEELQLANDSLEETRFLFDAQEQQIERIRKEKQLIEGEWSRVIRQVNGKMAKLQHRQEEEEKENVEMLANLPLKDKVKKALRRIDRELKETDEQVPRQEWNFNKDSPSNSTSGMVLGQDSYEY